MYGARSENRLLEKLSPKSVAIKPANNITKRNLRFPVAAMLSAEDGGVAWANSIFLFYIVRMCP